MRKALAIILAMSLLCILSVGGTLTYFTDTDWDANTMVVGKVEIEQHEQYRKGVDESGNTIYGDWGAEYTPHLYPYTGSDAVDSWYDTSKNAIDKIVTVKNTGSESAWIRTLFAFEAVNGADPVESGIIHVNYNDSVGEDNQPIGKWEKVTSITRTEGEEENQVTTTYYIYSFTYTKSYEGNNTTTEASLKQIALDYSQGNEFYEAVGESYDILVLSQAVQAAGFVDAEAAFTAAFPYGPYGADYANVAGWFEEVN